MSVPLFVAQEIGRTLSDENVWLPTVTIALAVNQIVYCLVKTLSNNLKMFSCYFDQKDL